MEVITWGGFLSGGNNRDRERERGDGTWGTAAAVDGAGTGANLAGSFGAVG